MPDRWIDDHVGDELRPRAGFEDALAGDLQRAWSGAPRRNWLRVSLAAAALLAVVAGGLVLLRQDNTKHITVAPSTLDTATTAQPTSSAPSSVTEPAGTTSTTTTVTTTSGPVDPNDPVVVVGSYLSALAEGRYMDAAKLLGEGGLELEARADIRPLFSAPYGLVPGQATQEALAGALERWCRRSLCAAPFEVTAGDNSRQVATYDDGGVARASTFVGYTFEGQPGVQGLPLQAPPAYQWVGCPTDHVGRAVWADVDGDGWWEQLVVQTLDDNGTNLVTVCGTQLQVQPLEVVDGEGVWIYAVNPDESGPDDLLIGSVPPFVSGHVHRLDNGVLADTGAVFGFIALTGQPGESTGCADVDGDGTNELVNYDWQFVGGTDVADSTSLTYSMSDAFDPNLNTEQRSIALPAGADEAVQLISGYCNGLPVTADGG